MNEWTQSPLLVFVVLAGLFALVAIAVGLLGMLKANRIRRRLEQDALKRAARKVEDTPQ